MVPDPGCYEERYRLTGSAVLRLAVGLVWLGLGVFWQSRVMSVTSVILAIPMIFSALAVAFAMPGVIAIARRMVVFRADYAGITLGVLPSNLAALREAATFIPWAEVERIVLYPAYSRGQHAYALVQGVAVQRRKEAAATGTARKFTGWKLDRERLTAVTAAVAPGIPVVDAGYRHRPGR
jgi:hypothetical protein